MEIIQATQVSLLPQETHPVTWSNNSVAPYSHFLLLSTPSDPALSVTPTNSSFLLNTCQNCTKTEHGSLPGLAGIFIPLIYGIVCVVGLLGNTLVIHVIVNYTKNESVTNIYILNLAIADELFMLGLPFLAVQNALLSWPFGSLMCRVVMTVDAINQFTSIFCLTVMSVDRYLAVVHPIRSSWWRRPHVAKAISTTVWAGSFVVVLPVVVFADVLKDDGNCSIVWPEPAEVRSVGKRAQASSSRRRKSERKITRMVVVVVAVFVLCWLPFYALNIVNLLVVLPGDFRGLYFLLLKALCRTSRRVKSNDRAVTEVQRPTEEWGGIVLQLQKSGGVSAHREDCGENEDEEEINRREGAVQMSEIRKNSENGDGASRTR
ncbi:hypothetical protein INR49_004579, partial [Caranx melampygus]